jgi:hypothetical protein
MSLVCLNGRSAEILSAQSGSWTAASTWAGGVPPTQSDNVTIKQGHTVTLPSSGTRVCTNLTIETGGKLYAGTTASQRYLDVYGNIICNGTIGNGSSGDGISFNIEGSSCSVSGSGSFDASRMRKNNGTNSVTTLTFSMNVFLRYGGTAIFNNKSASHFHVVISPGVTLSLPGSGGINGSLCIDGTNASNGSSYGGSVTVQGTLSVSGTLYLTTDNNSTAYAVSFTIATGGTVNCHSVICTNSGSAFHYTIITSGGVLNFTSGDWGVIGTTYNSYTFDPSSTVEFSGPGPQTVGCPSAYGNLIISGAGEKSLGGGETIVAAQLSVLNGCKLAVPQASALTVNGNLLLEDPECLVLKAGNAASSPGSMICNGTVSGAGGIRAECYIPAYTAVNDANFHQISSPVLSQDIQPGFVTEPPESSTDFYRWDEAQGLWVNSKTASGVWNTSFQPGDDRKFLPGRGYLAAYSSDVVKVFSGIPGLADKEIPITYSGGTYAGYNLAGNPFTSALNANIHQWTSSQVSNSIWVWDASAGNYLTWNGLIGTLDGGIIPAMQGFFVKASGPSPSLLIPASSRTHGSHPCYKSALPMVLRADLSRDGYRDGIVIGFPRPFSGVFDSLFNVSKLDGSPAAPQLWIKTPKNHLSVLMCPEQTSDQVFELGLEKRGGDSLVFTFSGMDSFDESFMLLFEDRQEGRTMDLREFPVYSFVCLKTREEGRFFIHYRKATSTDETQEGPAVRIYSSQGSIRIAGLEDYMGLEKLCIFDMTGRKVLERIIPPGSVRVRVNLLPAWYLARLDYGRKSVTEKLLIVK